LGMTEFCDSNFDTMRSAGPLGLSAMRGRP
jgi:hypothetical protein